MHHRTLISGVAAAAMFAIPAAAQQEQTQEQETQVAQQCYEDLQGFGERIQEEGYWLTGVRDRWGTTGWGDTAGGAYYPGVGMPGGTAGAPPAAGTTDAPEETTDTAEGTAGTVDAVNPPAWGLGVRSPGVQIETLFRAAHVLAVRGDQEGCQAVLSELTDLYDEYVGTLQEAGVEPGQVAGWRQEMIVAAQPVSELEVGRVSTDEITGTEVRNMQDEYLGDVDDVIISDGEVQHVVISRGGFLGLGENYVAVPWEAMSATPGLNLFLLDVPEEALEQAPEISGDVRQLTGEQQEQVSQYWQQQGVD